MKHYSRIAVLLAVSLIAGCHKSAPNAENPPAGTPATQPTTTDQSQSTAAPAQAPASTPAQSSAAASGAPTPSAPAASASSTPGAAAPAPGPAPAPPQEAAAPAPALPAVPAGTVLSIRMNQTINVKHTSAGAPFTGTIVSPILVDGNTVIPSGATAEGMVVRAHKRGRFKGASYLQLTLTGLNVNGQHYRIDTSSLTRTKKGKGKRTFGFIGGGTGLGMLIGGVATGGVGLLVGGLAGAGAGTGLAAFTGNKDITIPAESVVNFKLAAPIQLR